MLSFSIVDLGSLQSSCQNTKCQIAALKRAPSRGTSGYPRKENHLVLGLITSAPRLHSFDLSQASSTEPDWKLRNTLKTSVLLIIFNAEHRRTSVALYSPLTHYVSSINYTLYCQKYSLINPNNWNQVFQSLPWPHMYKSKHLVMQTVSTNIY